MALAYDWPNLYSMFCFPSDSAPSFEAYTHISWIQYCMKSVAEVLARYRYSAKQINPAEPQMFSISGLKGEVIDGTIHRQHRRL